MGGVISMTATEAALAELEDELLVATDLNVAIAAMLRNAGYREGLDASECLGLMRVADAQGRHLTFAKEHWNEAHEGASSDAPKSA